MSIASDNKVVYHRNQGVFEYYVNHRPATEKEKLELFFEYSELTHHMQKKDNGLYGEYIDWI